MKRLLVSLVLLFACTIPVLAEGATGSISTCNADTGIVTGSFPPTAEIESRDIFTIVQKGKPIGEAMVIKVERGRITLLPRKVTGTPRPGDTLAFARHADVPLDGTEGWKVFNGPEFSVMVPSKPVGPKVEKGTSEQGNGYTRSAWISVDDSDHTAYLITVEVQQLHNLGNGEHWENAESSLEYAIQQRATKLGKLNWMRPCTANGMTGREYEIATTKGWMLRGRLFASQTTFYEVVATTEGGNVSSHAWKALNSFQVKLNKK